MIYTLDFLLGTLTNWDDFVENYVQRKFTDGQPTTEVLETLAFSKTVMSLVTIVGTTSANWASGGAFKASMIPLQETLGGVGLAVNVAADIARIAHLIDSGDRAGAELEFGSLFAGIGGALFLGIFGIATGAPAIGLMAIGYMVGQFLFSHRDVYIGELAEIWDAIGNALEHLPGVNVLGDIVVDLASPLANIIRDPLVLDLDGDGIELSPLSTSSVHFDYDGDGFAERTGWVSADDGILVYDANNNGDVDSAAELFGSPTQDGFAVLETLDSNGDGIISSADENFDSLRVWRDLNQNGSTDEGELSTLSGSGIASIALSLIDPIGTNAGHTIGYESQFIRQDGETGVAQTVYFQTDRQDTVADNTPEFTPGEGIAALPQLSGSGQINSIAYTATNNPGFATDWEELTDAALVLAHTDLRSRFQQLLLTWAGVADEDPTSRGEYVDARHLSFVEKYFGTHYSEQYAGEGISTSPSRDSFGSAVEASFLNISDAMLTIFLAQSTRSALARGGDISEAIHSPYFSYILLDLDPSGALPPSSPGNVTQVVNFLISLMPVEIGEASQYLIDALAGLNGMASIAFLGDREAYVLAVADSIASIGDPILRQIGIAIISGDAFIGSSISDGGFRVDGDDIFLGGAGDDFFSSAAGSDIFVHSRGDGTDYIRDTGSSDTDIDTLLLSDLRKEDLVFERIGNTLLIKVNGSTDQIIVEDFFRSWETDRQGIDQILFADGALMNREDIRNFTTTVGDGRNNLVVDTSQDDVLRGGSGHDTIRISGGDDIILYGAGDGFDLIDDITGAAGERDTLILVGLMPADVEFSRNGDHLLITVKSTGETITSEGFFWNSSNPAAADGWNNHGWGISHVQFENGVTWDRASIQKAAWIRGNDNSNGLDGSGLADTLQGRGGNDALSGGEAADTYVWSKGDGDDTIEELQNSTTIADRLWLTNVSVSDVKLTRSGEHLLITVLSTGETVQVVWQFAQIEDLSTEASTMGFGIETLEFANGITWNRQAIANAVGQNSIGLEMHNFSSGHYVGNVWYYTSSYYVDEFGNRGNIWNADSNYDTSGVSGGHDVAFGNGESETFGAGDRAQNFGDNYFSGEGGNDLLVGGQGNDSLLGGDGNDEIYGDDLLVGGAGAIGHDSIDGGAGIDLLYGGAGNDNIQGGTGADELYGGNGSDTLQDGSTGDDVFDGGKGDDAMLSTFYRSGANSGASNGNDTFVYRLGDGNDAIFDGSYSTNEVDRLVLHGIDPGGVEVAKSGNHLVLNVLATGERIVDEHFFWNWGNVGHGIDRVEFDNGTTWNRAEIDALVVYRGTDGRDYLQANDARADTFIGESGDDVIVSASTRTAANSGAANGSDTFIYKSGDGNDLIFDGSHSLVETDRLILSDLGPDEIELSRIGNDLLIKVLSTNETITTEGFFWSWGNASQGIERLQFKDGTFLNRSELREMAWYRGTETKDVIQGAGNLADTFMGGLGDDLIISAQVRGAANSGGANGNDTFIYRSGDGNDIIFDGSHSNAEVDELVFVDINPEDIELYRDGDHLKIKISATGEVITNEYFFWNWETRSHGIEKFTFADGSSWNRTEILFWSREGSAFFAGTTGNDTIIGSYLDQRLSGGAGHDVIDGGAGSDLIFGDAGNDRLDVSIVNPGEIDTLDGGAGVDTVSFRQFGAAVFVDLVSNLGEASTTDAIDLTSGTLRKIVAIAGIENVEGSEFSDEILGDGNSNALIGGAGDDFLDGRSGDDTLEGSEGNDTLLGYLGNDSYIYSRGDGHDVYSETVGGPIGGAADRIVLTDILPGQILIQIAGQNLVIVVEDSIVGLGDGGSITIVAPVPGPLPYDQYGIEIIQFADGSVWDALYLQQLWITRQATDGDDTLVGNAASGLFSGGRGNDALNGMGGDDTYEYSRGDGFDTITEAAGNGTLDKLNLSNISAGAISLVQSGTDVTVVVAGSAPGAGDSGSILLKGQLSGANVGVEQIIFADGTTWFSADIRDQILQQASTSADDIITGFSSADTIRAGGGDDIISGLSGNDSYLYARGDGNDTITEPISGGDGDKLVLEGINPSDVSLLRNGSDVTLVIAESNPGAGDGGSILLKSNLDEAFSQGIDQIVFSDGTIWTRATLRSLLVSSSSSSGNDTINGTSASDLLSGGLGNDTLNGAGGNDTYLYTRGDGDDTVIEPVNNGVDKLILEDINPSDVTLVRNSNDVTLVVAESSLGAGDGGSIRLVTTLVDSFNQGIDSIVFSDGTIWTRADLQAALLTQASTTGDDTVLGFTSADTVTGGLGNDALNGAGGNDTYIYARGDGNDIITEGYDSGVDKLILHGIAPTEVSLVRNGNDVTLVIAESNPGLGDVGSVSLVASLNDSFNQGMDSIIFDDGTIWTRATMRTALLVQSSTTGNDTVLGFASSDTIIGGLGNDALNGATGNDTYIYARGDGDDTITEGYNSGVDGLILQDIDPADVSLVRNGNDVTLVIAESILGAGDGGSILLKLSLEDSFSQGMDSIAFDNGSIWTRATLRASLIERAATDGNDTIVGFASADNLTGGLGNDALNGAGGSDNYIYTLGDGYDMVTEANNSGTDKVSFSGVASQNVTILRNGADLILSISESAPGAGDAGAITLKGQLGSGNSGIEEIVFADAAWSKATLLSRVVSFGGTDLDDVIVGTTAADTINLGKGDDTVSGLAGSDTFVFRDGFGLDIITDFAAGAGTTDVIEFSVSDFDDFISVLASAAQVGSDTVVTLDGDDSLTLRNVSLSSLHVDDFRFV